MTRVPCGCQMLVKTLHVGCMVAGPRWPPRPWCYTDHCDLKLSEKQRVQERLVGPLLSPWMQDENLL